MPTTAPSPLLSDSLRGLGLDTGTWFFVLNNEISKIEAKGLVERFKEGEKAVEIDLTCDLYDSN